jgi:NADH dehydrogenase/NADH:ubiquinone oxidoreductase subunit G
MMGMACHINRTKFQQIGSNHRQTRITMKTQNLIAAGIISAGLTFGVTAQAHHEETQVEMKDLPAAVQTTIKDKAGNDQILRIEKETRKGKECYEAIVNKDGKETAIQIDASGKYLGTHDEKAEHQKAEKAEKH